MKATGIVRRIDDLGRLVVPREIRRTFGIREGDPFELFLSEDGDGVVFKKYNLSGPVETALKSLRVAVEDSEGLSCRMEFLQSITELEARLKLEEDEH